MANHAAKERENSGDERIENNRRNGWRMEGVIIRMWDVRDGQRTKELDRVRSLKWTRNEGMSGIGGRGEWQRCEMRGEEWGIEPVRREVNGIEE